MNDLKHDHHDIDFDDLNPLFFDVSLCLGYSEDEYSLLRSFRADVTFVSAYEIVHNVGSVTGWLTRRADSAWLASAGDSMSAYVAVLAFVAEDIVDSPDLGIIENVLMIDRVTLAEDWRGHKLFGLIVKRIVDLLQVYPTSTIAVTQPEPLSLTTGEALKPGPTRDAGMVKLHRACGAAGFEQWKETIVWWRTFVASDVDPAWGVS